MMRLDDENHRILRERERDGRLGNIGLAGRVVLSPSACLRRVQALGREGVIAGYWAVLRREKTGVGFTG